MSSTKKMKAKHTFVPLLKKEISLVEGEVIQVVAEHEDGWWEGKRSNGQTGFFPSCYCVSIDEKEELSLPEKYQGAASPLSVEVQSSSPDTPMAKLESVLLLWSKVRYLEENNPNYQEEESTEDDRPPLERTGSAAGGWKGFQRFKSEKNFKAKKKGGGGIWGHKRKESITDNQTPDNNNPLPTSSSSSNSLPSSSSSSRPGSNRAPPSKPPHVPGRRSPPHIPSSVSSNSLPSSSSSSSSVEPSNSSESLNSHSSPSISPSSSPRQRSPSSPSPTISASSEGVNLPSPAAGASKESRARTHILKELMSTEETYVKGLLYLQHGFIEGLDASGLITPEYTGSIKVFGSLKSLVAVHNNLLRDLRLRYQDFQEDKTKVGDLLCQILPYFKLYVEYINFYGACLDEVRLLSVNKKTGSIISKLRVNDDFEGFYGFSSLLVTPIQRIPRYEMLFRDLYQHTKPDHCDYADLKKAAEDTQALANFINEQKRKIETEQRLGQISSGLRGARNAMRESVYTPGDMGGGDAKAKAHSWKPKSWKEPIWCALCNKICVENGKFKGYQCKNCSMYAHKACSVHAPKTCGMAGEESLIKHDRSIILEVDKVTYTQKVGLEKGGKEDKKAEGKNASCTLFIFNDSFVCVEDLGDGEYNLLCMIKMYSRISTRFAKVDEGEGKIMKVVPAREEQLFHLFAFVDEKERLRVEKVAKDAVAEFRSIHENQEQRRQHGTMSRRKIQR